MGIRFYCDACDRKLNVKAFLAGKKGICPHCGARVLIPHESKIPSSKDNKEVAVNPPDMEQSESRFGEPAVAVKKAVPVAAAAPAAKAAPPDPPSPDVPNIRDPIAEAPNAIWYVRPPSGGQYGPADGEVMRRWIGEGRVSADSLIWREGWDDWKTAGPEFPELSGEKKESPAEASPKPASPSSAAPATSGSPAASNPVNNPSAGSSTSTSRSRRRPNNNGMGVAVIAVLGLLVVVLGIIFIYLLVNSGDESDEEGQTHRFPPIELYAPSFAGSEAISQIRVEHGSPRFMPTKIDAAYERFNHEFSQPLETVHALDLLCAIQRRDASC